MSSRAWLRLSGCDRRTRPARWRRIVELVVFVGILAVLSLASYFFGTDSRQFSTARADDVVRWSR
jgi:hypothetical protein